MPLHVILYSFTYIHILRLLFLSQENNNPIEPPQVLDDQSTGAKENKTSGAKQDGSIEGGQDKGDGKGTEGTSSRKVSVLVASFILRLQYFILYQSILTINFFIRMKSYILRIHSCNIFLVIHFRIRTQYMT